MKKRIFSFILAAILLCTLLPLSALAAVTSLSGVTFTVKANKDAGLGGDVNITFTKSGGSYSGALYLPGSADTDKLMLSWDEGVTVAGCTSGETAIPGNGNSKTYSVTVGGNTANFTVKTMQGSAGVEGMFLTIDESLGTIKAMLGDQNHEETCYGNLSLDGNRYDMSIKGRGNSSWTFNFDKKPFNITLYKNEDISKEIAKYSEKKKAELIDGVEAKKWSILANAKDSSLLRNKIGYDIALAMGLGIDSRFIDVWMNGEYLGNYLLTPKTDTIAPKNGYQIELERRTDNEDPQFTLKGFENGTRPIYFTVKDNGANAETADIKAYMQKVADAILDTKSSDYLNYIDLDSWAKMYLLNELYKDVDVVTDSIFMYRNGTDDGDKLCAGPIWDLDGAIGRTYSNGYCGVDNTNQTSPDKWYIDGIQYDNNRGYLSWFQMLGRHQDFMQRVYELYNEYSDAFNALEAQITEQADVIADSANMNFNIHPVNQTVERMFNVEGAKSVGSGAYKITYKATNSWSDYVDNLKKFVTARNAFLSDNLTVTAPAGSITGATSYAVGDTLTLTADCTASSYQWQTSPDGVNWTDIDGAAAKTYSATALYSMNNVQFRCVAKNVGKSIITTRVAKAAPSASTVLAPVTLTVTLDGHEHNYQTVVTQPTCTEQGYTTHTCSCGDSYVDDYTDALGHNFVDGQCTRCPEKDPDYIPQCVTDKSVSLSAGTFTFTLGGQKLGEYTFAKSGNNWTIRDQSGKYLGFANRALSDNAFGWTYSNGRFQTSVTTTTTTGSGGWGGFFGWGGSRNRTTTTTTTYYLAYTGGRITVSTGTSGTNAGFTQHIENLNHSFGAWTQAANGQHARTCSVCGETETESCTYGADHKCTVCGGYNPDDAVVRVNVTTSQRTSGWGGFGWSWGGFGWNWGGGSRTTTYTATITATAIGTTVTKVEYQLDGGRWTTGTSVSSNKPINSLNVRVWDSNGTAHEYTYGN